MAYTIQELRNVCLWPSHGVQEYPTEHADQVYPGLFLGDAHAASDLDALRRDNVGYVLNAAYGLDASLNLLKVYSQEEYEKAGFVFLGIPAIDMSSYPLHKHFQEATDFIRRGLSSGKCVLVHCKQGISRSAALVVAYLVQELNMDVKDALREVRSKREIFPNDGFMQQLAEMKNVS